MTCPARLAPAPANRQFPGRMMFPLLALALRGAIRLYQLTLAYKAIDDQAVEMSHIAKND